MVASGVSPGSRP